MAKQNTISIIKRKLDSISMLNLDPEEICAYINYRIDKLLEENRELSYYDLRYHLCELGPWKRRIDPFSLEIVLHSKLFQYISAYKLKTINDIEFIIGASMSDSLIDEEIKLHAIIIDAIKNLTKHPQVLKFVNELLVSNCEARNFKVIDSSINFQEKSIECMISTESIFKKNVLIRYHNNGDWIYPESSEIWSLHTKASQINCIPILLAPRIFGSCFQLFKNIGMYGRSNYYIFLPNNFKTSMIVINNNAINLSKYIFSRYETIMKRMEYNIFNELDDLLVKIIPNSAPIFIANYNRKRKTIDSFASDILLNEGRSIKNRLSLLNQLLGAKILKGKNIRELIKKWGIFSIDLNR